MTPTIERKRLSWDFFFFFFFSWGFVICRNLGFYCTILQMDILTSNRVKDVAVDHEGELPALDIC